MEILKNVGEIGFVHVLVVDRRDKILGFSQNSSYDVIWWFCALLYFLNVSQHL